MIGIAIADRILDFSLHKDNGEKIWGIDRLRTVKGILAVFDKMIGGAVDNSYHYTAP